MVDPGNSFSKIAIACGEVMTAVFVTYQKQMRFGIELDCGIFGHVASFTERNASARIAWTRMMAVEVGWKIVHSCREPRQTACKGSKPLTSYFALVALHHITFDACRASRSSPYRPHGRKLLHVLNFLPLAI